MEKAFPIIMLAMSGGMLLYAGLIALGGFDLIPRSYAVKVRDKKKYARRFAALIALLAWAPAVGGITALIFGNPAGLIVTAAALVLAIWLGRYVMRNSND